MGKHGKKMKRLIKKNREQLNSERRSVVGVETQGVSEPGADDRVEIPGTSVTHQQVGC